MSEVSTASRVRLFASLEKALAVKKARALSAGSTLLGDVYATPASLLGDLWAVWGDERRIIGAHERLGLVLSLLGQQSAFACTVGAAKVIADFLRRYAGSISDCGSDVSLAASEREMLDFVERYRAALDLAGLIEPGQAAALLAQLELNLSVVWEEPVEAPLALMRFLDAASERPLRGGAGLSAPELPAGVEPSFAFPAGPAASVPVIRAELLSYLDSLDALSDIDPRDRAVAVYAPDPAALFESLSRELVDRGVVVRASYSIPISRTAFGRALGAVREIAAEGSGWRRAVVDFAYSPYAGMSRSAARDIDRAIRGNRAMSCAAACELASEASPSFSLFAAFARRFDSDSFSHLSACCSQVEFFSRAEAMAESGALAASERILAECASISLEPSIAGELIFDSSVSVSIQTQGDSVSAVEFLPLSSMGRKPQATLGLVMIGDCTDGCFPTTAKRTSLDFLAEKLGARAQVDPALLARCAFAQAMLSARRGFSCIMPLRDEAAQETYPAFFIEDYAAALSAGEDLADDCPLSLSEALYARARLSGEDDLVECVGRRFDEPFEVESFDAPVKGALSHADLLQGMTVRGPEGARDIPVLSPSALEAYLSCPYRWFVERRIGLREIDEGFGPAEKGSFVHEAFAAIYDELASRGTTRVDADNIDAVEKIALHVLDELAADQKRRSGQRLVAVTRAEELEIDILRDQVVRTLRRMVRLPRGFEVLCHERQITREDCVDYAGARLIGRVDRVDVNRDSGRFVVLDYKGSSAGYTAGFSEEEDASSLSLPKKVQALVYAQAFRRMHGSYACAGAMYLGYRAKNDSDFAAGSYDESAYFPDGLAKKTSCVEMNFDCYLDAVEEAIRPYVDALASGDISARPQTKDVCSYCPVASCEGRL